MFSTMEQGPQIHLVGEGMRSFIMNLSCIFSEATVEYAGTKWEKIGVAYN